jgi:hypothetical protein
MHKEDLRRVAPLWLKFTEDVRFDPDVSPRTCIDAARLGGWRPLSGRSRAKLASTAAAPAAHKSAALCPCLIHRRPGNCLVMLTAPTRAIAPGSARCTATATAAPLLMFGTWCTTQPCSTLDTKWRVGGWAGQGGREGRCTGRGWFVELVARWLVWQHMQAAAGFPHPLPLAWSPCRPLSVCRAPQGSALRPAVERARHRLQV